jgi:hypothetical protein
MNPLLSAKYIEMKRSLKIEEIKEVISDYKMSKLFEYQHFF